MNETRMRPLEGYVELPEAEMLDRARAFRGLMESRRTVRSFDARAVPGPLIADCIAAAASAPSGANLQPWHFVAVSDPATKRRIRLAAEEEERLFYQRRAPDEWLRALAPLGTDWQKPQTGSQTSWSWVSMIMSPWWL